MALPAVPSASIITVFLIVRVFQIPEQAVSLLFIVEFIKLVLLFLFDALSSLLFDFGDNSSVVLVT